MLVKTIILVIICYGIGCLNTGYYYTRLFLKKDIREFGTGVTGAMNVSQLAGRKGFILTFLGDALKGALIVLMARNLFSEEWGVLLCILFVLIGHIFPIQLRFRGGKGMSTIFGALLTYHPFFILLLFLTCVVFFPFVRKYTITSLYAFLVFPLELFFADYSTAVVLFAIAYSVLIIYACRRNIRDYIKDRAYHN